MIIIRINMTNGTIKREENPEKYKYLGGRSLTSTIVNDEVKPKCDPLGVENKLVIAPGIFSGTSLVNSGRLSIGAKSPLTNTIKESNVGGTIAATIAKKGIAAIIIEGKAEDDKFYIVNINNEGNCKLIQADEYKKLKTYSLCNKIYNKYGDEQSIVCIGPAGEQKLKCASIQATDIDGRPCRSCGRGGLGAVMGSKGLKAIIVDRKKQTNREIIDKVKFNNNNAKLTKDLKAGPFTGNVLPNLGTAALVALVNSIGALPSYNATKGNYDKWEKISGEAMADIIQKRGGENKHRGCSNCIIQCSNEYVDFKGDYITSSLEYETMWANGAMCGIDDLDIIAQIDRECDECGLDTMSTGVAVAVAMDAGYLEFGDAKGALNLVRQIADGTEVGKVIGNGPSEVGKYFNHHRIPVCKNQSIAGYDPRAIQGMAVTYSTCPMGADHTAGNFIGDALKGDPDPLKREGQSELCREKQIMVAALDSTGLCLFALSAVSYELLAALVSAMFDDEINAEGIKKMGIDTLNAELDFNKKAGFTNQDDRLSLFFYEEPLPPYNKTILVKDDDIDNTLNFVA